MVTIGELGADQAYHIALGTFVEAYAMYEHAMLDYLIALAGVDPRLVTIFCGGANLDQRKEFIRKIWKLRPPPPAVLAELEDAFSHAGPITELRNLILHSGTTEAEGGERISTDELRALHKPNEDVRVRRLSPHMLIDMSFDITKCVAHLFLAARDEWPTAGGREPSAGMVESRQRAWQHIPPPNQTQKSSKPERRNRTPKSERHDPPQPSPE